MSRTDAPGELSADALEATLGRGSRAQLAAETAAALQALQQHDALSVEPRIQADAADVLCCTTPVIL